MNPQIVDIPKPVIGGTRGFGNAELLIHIPPYDHRWKGTQHEEFRNGCADNYWWLCFWRARKFAAK